MSLLDRVGQKLLFTFDPETAHGMSIAALRCGLPVASRPIRNDRLKVSICGIDFPNPLGMAAGYDKNAEVPDALLRLRFRRGGHGHATAAGRQPEAAHLPADGGQCSDQPVGLQQ